MDGCIHASMCKYVLQGDREETETILMQGFLIPQNGGHKVPRWSVRKTGCYWSMQPWRLCGSGLREIQLTELWSGSVQPGKSQDLSQAVINWQKSETLKTFRVIFCVLGVILSLYLIFRTILSSCYYFCLIGRCRKVLRDQETLLMSAQDSSLMELYCRRVQMVLEY